MGYTLIEKDGLNNMIFGNINDKNQFDLLCKDPDFKIVMDYLKKGDFEGTEGTFYIDNNIKVIKSDIAAVKEFDINNYEAHKKFIDVHFVLDGVEEMYVAPIDSFTVVKEYNPDKDVMFGRCDYGQKVILRKGDYCVTYPEDAHRPACGHGNHLVKFCVKVAVK